ncbi:peptide deformylase, partial [Nitrospinae bacterium AH_259_B05_G02_I21]|nr:peptide deformylase [Nitrospinae bacterium AH_259_B05_G02_I21]
MGIQKERNSCLRWGLPRGGQPGEGRIMAREIVVFPHPTLRKVCDSVHTFDAELRLLVEEMFEAMQRAPG